GFVCSFLADTAPTGIYTLSLHDALPILRGARPGAGRRPGHVRPRAPRISVARGLRPGDGGGASRPEGRAGGAGRVHAHPHARVRSEEHTSELQSRGHLVCRLLLEKKKTK